MTMPTDKELLSEVLGDGPGVFSNTDPLMALDPTMSDWLIRFPGTPTPKKQKAAVIPAAVPVEVSVPIP